MSRSAPYHHGNLPEALERAAMELLATTPASDISLREVARQAGVSHNAPYHHFGDRRALLKVLAERSMADLVALERAIGDEDSAVERLRAFGHTYLDFAIERPHAFAVIYDPSVCVPGAPTATMAPLIAELETLLSTAVHAAVPEADDAGLAALTAAAWGVSHGLAQLARAGHLAPSVAHGALDVLIARTIG